MKLKRKLITGLFSILFVILLIAIPAPPALGAGVGTIVLSTSSGFQGTGVTITGTGFTPMSTYAVNMVNAVLTSGVVAADGTINTTVSIPKLPRSTYGITITTSSGDTTGSPPSFTVMPQIVGNRTTGQPGEPVIINGSGFIANSLITFYLDAVPVGTTQSDLTGSFSGATITIPQNTRGNHYITASDGGAAPAGINFKVVANLVLSTNNTASGKIITVSGSGFTPHAKISFFFDNASIGSPIDGGTSGSFTDISLTLPNSAPGTHIIKAQDSSGAGAESDININSFVSIVPDKGVAGTPVTISGIGFLANNAIRITYNGNIVVTSPASLLTNATGNFNGSFSIPSGGGGGSFMVTAGDGNNSASVNFTVTGTGTLNPTSGPVGTSVLVSGSGMTPNGMVTISYLNLNVATSNTDANGNFASNFQILPGSGGEHPVVITDRISTITLNFKVVPSAKISLTSGVVGSDISISGTGFAASKSLTVNYDASQVASASTDAAGAFNVSFKAPVSKGGNHVISVSDGSNNSSFNFAMDSTPPAVPVNYTPADGSQADSMPVMQWSSVSDPSGVTYILQIATDAGFANVILQKSGMVDPAYKLTEVEQLKDVSKSNPYYWRVKAIDGASNESNWSNASSFYMGSVLGAWVIPTIAGLFVIIIGVVLYVLLRPRGRKV